MFSGGSTIVKKDNEATLICLHLLLCSEANTYEYDPDFGIKIRRYYFEQNNYILKNILIDEIYTKISTFCPQLYLERGNIKITHENYMQRFFVKIEKILKLIIITWFFLNRKKENNLNGYYRTRITNI